MKKNVTPKKYTIIDNFLNKKDSKIIFESLTSNQFNYSLGRQFSTSLKNEQRKAKKDFSNIKEYYQFCHMLYDNEVKSDYFFIVEKILEKYVKKFRLKYVDLLRAKVNFQPKNVDFKKNNHNTPHRDSVKPHMALLYYVNDSDGETFLFDKNKILKKIQPKKNRLLIFDGDILHAGSHPSKHDFRLVINIDILKKP